jgi:hypothetical protein
VRGLCPRTLPAKRRDQIPERKRSFRAGALALRAVRGYEQAAVGALETPVTLGLAGQQLGGERLLAVRAHDLVRRFLGGDLGHLATLPVLGRPPAGHEQRSCAATLDDGCRVRLPRPSWLCLTGSQHRSTHRHRFADPRGNVDEARRPLQLQGAPLTRYRM